jgi:hypothetical protein
MPNLQLRIVAHNSDEYQQAALLRYRLFFDTLRAKAAEILEQSIFGLSKA